MSKIEMSLVMESGWFEKYPISFNGIHLDINACLENDSINVSYNAHLNVPEKVDEEYRKNQPNFKEKVDYIISTTDDMPDDGKLYMRSTLRKFLIDKRRLHLIFDIDQSYGTECLDVWMDENVDEEIRRKLSCGSVWWIAKVRHDK